MAEKESEKVKKRTGKLLNSFVVLTIVLSVLAVSVAPVIAPVPPPSKPTEIVVSASPSSIPAEIGSISTITAKVTNWTNKDTHPTAADFLIYFEIVEPTPGTSISPGQNMTDGDGNASATLTAGAGVAPGTVTVKATAEGGDADPVNTTITLTSEYDVELIVDQPERTTAPGANASYTLTVKNTGTLTDSYTLSVDNVNSADVADLSTGSITDLGAGETEDVSLTVRDADIGTYIVNVTVEGSEGVSDMVTTKTIVITDAEAPVVTNPNANPATILNDNGRPRPSGTNISRLNVTVTDEGSGVSTITINLSPIGGSPTQGMTNIGGDVWSVETSATAGINETHNLVVNATDNLGYSNTSVSIPLTVLRRGDIVRDNIVDDGDLMYLAKYIVGREPAPDQLVADVWPADSWDGVDDADLMYIAKYIVGKESEP